MRCAIRGRAVTAMEAAIPFLRSWGYPIMYMQRQMRRLLGLTGITVLVASVALPCAAQTAALTVLAHNRPRGIAAAHYIGNHDPNATMDVVIALNLRNQAGLQQLLANLQNQNSPSYHAFLTPAQFTAEFGPTQSQVQAITQYLVSEGVRVTSVSSNRELLHAHASTATLQSAFHVAIGDYSLNGRDFYAPVGYPQLPSAVASMVTAVIGLSDFNQMHPMSVPAAGNGVAVPNKGKPGGGGGTTAPSGYSPQQIATAYNWPAVTNTGNGAGQTIAIATAYSFKSSDLTGFWNQYGLPNHTVTIVPVDGSTTRTNVETTIDIERSGAMAPGATILVYEGANAQLTTFTDVYNAIVTANTAGVMTTSWGTAESNMSTTTLNADDNIFKQAAAQGISLFAAAGDNGSSDGTSNTDEADYPSSDPYVAACGGTSLTLASSGAIASETAWSGSGGAESHYFAEPSWQVGTNVPEDGYRQTSDFALDADPNTGYSVLYGGKWSVYGGTSFVAPQMAALFTVRNASAGSRLGQSNSAIYNLANTASYSADFHDITSGSNGAFSAGPYWDHPTGWGSVNATNFITDIK